MSWLSWITHGGWALAAVAGVLLLVAAVVWRQTHHARLSGRIADALRDPDPHRRRAAVVVATEQGLRANAALLAAHVNREQDPMVLQAVIDSVLRNAWEPSDRPAILALRLWAHARHAAQAGPSAAEIEAEHRARRHQPAAPAPGQAEQTTRIRSALDTPTVEPPTDRLPPQARHRARHRAHQR